jgi:hypothetical protein
MRRALSLAGVAIMAAAFGAAPGAARAGTQASPPDPCKTFTTEAFDALYGLPAGTVPTEKRHIIDRGKDTVRRTCVATSGDVRLDVATSFAEGSINGPFKVYHRPKLGHSGEVLVSTATSFQETVARYERKDVFFSDLDNRIEKNKGTKLYKFALKQSRAFAKRT